MNGLEMWITVRYYLSILMICCLAYVAIFGTAAVVYWMATRKEKKRDGPQSVEREER